MDGELSSNPDDIAECICCFYRQLYYENVVDRPVLDDVEFSRIYEEDALWFYRLFDKEEVYGVINGFNGDKAPNPNGFPMAFFQSCWSVLKKEIMEVFQNFHT